MYTADSLGRDLDNHFVHGTFDQHILALEEFTNMASLDTKASDAFSVWKPLLFQGLDEILSIAGCAPILTALAGETGYLTYDTLSGNICTINHIANVNPLAKLDTPPCTERVAPHIVMLIWSAGARSGGPHGY